MFDYIEHDAIVETLFLIITFLITFNTSDYMRIYNDNCYNLMSFDVHKQIELTATVRAEGSGHLGHLKELQTGLDVDFRVGMDLLYKSHLSLVGFQEILTQWIVGLTMDEAIFYIPSNQETINVDKFFPS